MPSFDRCDHRRGLRGDPAAHRATSQVTGPSLPQHRGVETLRTREDDGTRREGLHLAWRMKSGGTASPSTPSSVLSAHPARRTDSSPKHADPSWDEGSQDSGLVASRPSLARSLFDAVRTVDQTRTLRRILLRCLRSEPACHARPGASLGHATALPEPSTVGRD